MVLGFMGCSSANKQSSSQASSASPTPAQGSTNANPNLVKKTACKKGTDNRSLEADKKGGGCELTYTKFGKSKVVASSNGGVKHCEDAFAKILKILQGQGFTCEGN